MNSQSLVAKLALSFYVCLSYRTVLFAEDYMGQTCNAAASAAYACCCLPSEQPWPTCRASASLHLRAVMWDTMMLQHAPISWSMPSSRMPCAYHIPCQWGYRRTKVFTKPRTSLGLPSCMPRLPHLCHSR